MDTKNLDAIKRMVTRLQAIKETDWLVFDTVVRINTAKELLQQIVDVYDKSSPTQDAEEVRDN